MNSQSLKQPDRWQWTAARPQGKSGWLGYAALALFIAWAASASMVEQLKTMENASMQVVHCIDRLLESA